MARRATAGQLPQSLGARADSILPTPLVEFGPDGLTFAVPATLTLFYDDGEIPAGGLETRLGIARIDDALEVLTDVVIDTTANSVSVEVDHFTFFAVYGPIAFPDRIEVTVEETVTFNDEPAVRAISPISLVIEEVVAISDSLPIEALPPLYLEVREAVRSSDEIGADAPGVARIDATESIAVTDVATVTAPGFTVIEVRESVGVQDAPDTSTPGTTSVGVAETIGVSDAVTVTPIASTQIYSVSAAGSLEVFNADGPTPATSIPLPVESSAIARRPGTSELWVIERTTENVTVVDGDTNTVVDSFYSESASAFTIDFDGAGTIGVVGGSNSSRLAVLDGATGALIGFADGLAAPVAAAEVSADGSTAWAASTRITRVDLDTRLPAGTSEIGTITFTSDMDLTLDESELWVTDGLGGVVVVHDASTLAVLDSIPLPASSTTGGESLVFSADGATAYVSTSGDGRIVVIDVASRLETDRLSVGASITQMALDPARNRIYASSGRLDDELLVFDLGTRTLTDRFVVTAPRGLLIYP